MADKNTVYMSEKQKVKEITDKLEAGLKELFEREKYKRENTAEKENGPYHEDLCGADRRCDTGNHSLLPGS